MQKKKCRLRHIAIAVKTPEVSAKFFEEAFGMSRVGTTRNGGIYMSDGVVNIALLTFGNNPILGFEDQPGYTGITHFGLWVDDVDEVGEMTKKAGGRYLTGDKAANPEAFYEVKYATPDGVVFDLTENGWRGAAKDVIEAP